MGDEQIMQPSRTGQAGVIGGIEHAGGIAQQALGVVERERLHEVLRCQSRPAPEQMMQFVGRQVRGIRHGFDGRLGTPLLGDEPDRAADRIVIAQCRALLGRLCELQIGEHGFHRGVHHGGVRYAVSIMIRI